MQLFCRTCKTRGNGVVGLRQLAVGLSLGGVSGPLNPSINDLKIRLFVKCCSVNPYLDKQLFLFERSMWNSFSAELKLDHDWDHFKIKLKQLLKRDQSCNHGGAFAFCFSRHKVICMWLPKTGLHNKIKVHELLHAAQMTENVFRYFYTNIRKQVVYIWICIWVNVDSSNMMVMILWSASSHQKVDVRERQDAML